MTKTSLPFSNVAHEFNKTPLLFLFAFLFFVVSCKRQLGNEEAIDRVADACLNGSASVCSEGALRLLGNKRDSDFELLYPAFENSCSENNTHGCHALAVIYASGVGVIKNRVFAIKLFDKACTAGYGEACFDGAHEIIEASAKGESHGSPWKQFLKSCALGHFSGCLVLGKKVFVDYPSEAINYTITNFQKLACHLGSSVGCFNYALALEKSDNGKFSWETSLRIYEKACDRGFIPACTSQGVLLLSNIANVESKARGISLLERGCSENNSVACFNLALSYSKNSNTLSNIDLAHKYFEKGCKLGDSESCTNLGNHFLLGQGREKDSRKAFDLYSAACSQGSGKACFNLGKLLENGTDGRSDKEKAKAMFESGCRLGEVQSCNLLSSMLLHETDLLYESPDIETFEDLITKLNRSCELQNAVACYRLGKVYDSLEGNMRSKIEARMAFTEGCRLDHTDSCFSLAQMYKDGQGGTKSVEESLKLLARLCTAENEAACRSKEETFNRK